MQRQFLTALTLLFTVALAAVAGEVHVRGPIFGTWTSGTAVFVDGPSYIPAGEALTIERGVSIRIKSSERILVFGALMASGEAHDPIVITAPRGWEGFDLRAENSDICEFRCVRISEAGGLPYKVITSANSKLRLEDCVFRAEQSCLDITGGVLIAHRNHFMTNKLFSRAVSLHDLSYGFVGDPCGDPDASQLSGSNMITVTVPRVDSLHSSEIYTAGLELINCSNICLDDIIIWVDAPGNAIGVFYRNANELTSPSILQRSIISVRSPNGQPCGVYAAMEGSLQVLFCNLDVATSEIDTCWAIGVRASVGANAYVNSSTVVLDASAVFFSSYVGGHLTVDRTDIFNQAGTLHGEGLPGSEHLLDGFIDMNNVSINHIIRADPQWRREGEWGQWQTPEDVYRYYSLLSTSPCIDSGDVRYGFDPDNTPPDIGCIYYDQRNNTPVGDRPDPEVIRSIILAPAFPNPFNAVTVIPFALAQTGNVEITAYDLLGRTVAELSRGVHSVGQHQVRFEGSALSSGLYIIGVKLNGHRIASQPVVLMK